MDKRVKVSTAMLSLALLVSLTMACTLPGLGGGATEEDTPPVAPPEASPTAALPAEIPTSTAVPQELPFGMEVGALENLDSYAYSLHMDGLSTSEGTAEEMVLDIQGQRQTRPTRAEELNFSSVSEGESSSMGFIYIEEENKIWTRDEGGAWEELPVMDPSMVSIFDSFSLVYWWDVMFVGDPEDAQYLGQENVNGVQAHHYRGAESTGWGFTVGCTFASVQDDIWVAVDGAFPVKRAFDAEGECAGERGEVHFLMEVSNVNQPVSVSPPM